MIVSESLAPSQSMKEFIDAVRFRMETEGITIVELSRRTGLSRPGLNNLLNGKAGSCTLATADAIATSLGFRLSLKLTRK